MSEDTFRIFIVAIAAGTAMGVLVFLHEIWAYSCEESRRWRRLIQLYLEKRVSAPLPIDEDPDAPAESLLSLPDEDLDEIERQQREEEEALRQ